MRGVFINLDRCPGRKYSLLSQLDLAGLPSVEYQRFSGFEPAVRVRSLLLAPCSLLSAALLLLRLQTYHSIYQYHERERDPEATETLRENPSAVNSES